MGPGRGRAKLEDAEGRPGFTALTHPFLFLGFFGIPGSDEGLQGPLGLTGWVPSAGPRKP